MVKAVFSDAFALKAIEGHFICGFVGSKGKMAGLKGDGLFADSKRSIFLDDGLTFRYSSNANYGICTIICDLVFKTTKENGNSKKQWKEDRNKNVSIA